MADEKTITSFEIDVGEDRARLTLEGPPGSNLLRGERLAFVDYETDAEPSAIINRGGFLSVTRPLDLLAPTLVLLTSGLDVTIDDKGNLNAASPVA